MKKHLTLALTSFLWLTFCLSCQNEETPAPVKGKNNKVEKLVFTDLRSDLITTMQFQYAHEKVQTVKWDFYSASVGVDYSYSENRFYSTNGALDSLAGNRFNGTEWNLSYEYKNGLRFKIKSKKDSLSSTTTFVEYKGTKPLHVENFFGVYGRYEGFRYPRISTLEFDDRGNLISQKHTDILGYPDVVHEKWTTYNTELNPLQNLIETPLPQLFDYYDDFSFYYSPNLPTSVEGNYPFVDPIHNRITFEYEKDVHGRVIQVKALRPDNNDSLYTLEITYLQDWETI